MSDRGGYDTGRGRGGDFGGRGGGHRGGGRGGFHGGDDSHRGGGGYRGGGGRGGDGGHRGGGGYRGGGGRGGDGGHRGGGGGYRGGAGFHGGDGGNRGGGGFHGGDGGNRGGGGYRGGAGFHGGDGGNRGGAGFHGGDGGNRGGAGFHGGDGGNRGGAGFHGGDGGNRGGGGYRGGAGFHGGDGGHRGGGGYRGRGGGDGFGGRGGGRGGRGGGHIGVSDENPQIGERFIGYNFEKPKSAGVKPKPQSERDFVAHFPPPKSANEEIAQATKEIETEIAEADKEAKVKLCQAMTRPSFGTSGERRIMLRANHFPINIPENMRVLHYDFTMGKMVTREKKAQPKPASASASTKSKKAKKSQDEAKVIVLSESENQETVLIQREKWPRQLALAAYTRLVWKQDAQPNLYEYRYKLIFDGMRNVFSQCNLGIPTDGTSFDIEFPNPDERATMETFRVTLKPAAVVTVDLKHVFNRNLVERKSTSTLILDLLLRQSKLFSHIFIPIGRRVFYRPEHPFPLSGGIERYPGVWESVRPVQGWKSTVNLDLANTAFVKPGSLLDLLPDVAYGYNGNPAGVRATAVLAKSLEKLVKGLKVDEFQRGPDNKRSSKCIGVSKLSADDLKFPMDVVGGKKENISVARYFELQKERGVFTETIRFRNLPCLQVGSKEKNRYIPMEFCAIKEGQRYPHKLNQDQTSNMLNAASQPAPERRQRIENQVNRTNLANDPYLQHFGVTVEARMVEFEGRVLRAPGIQYRGKEINPKEGGWDLRGTRVIRGCTISDWAVLCANKRIDEREIHDFCKELVKIARNMDITFVNERPYDIVFNDDLEGGALSSLKDLKNNAPGRKLDLVIVILPELSGSEIDRYYSSIKSAGDVDLGLNTQCVKGKNVRPGRNGSISPSLLANICLKINAKMGGVNNTLTPNSTRQIPHLAKPILILGADVNHPAPTDAKDAPSVAAVVGCIDKELASYAAKIMVQDRRKEFITDLKSAVHQMLDLYYSRYRMLPQRIVMFRDGVGETMFLRVLTEELKQIREACESMLAYLRSRKLTDHKVYEPPITFIVVQKRHHTRLFCVHESDAMGRGNNVPPGTVVDTTIVHPVEFDYYLCSHLGLQGTSRPGHYQVLWDDASSDSQPFSADDLQQMTYYLCHTYARATKSVSLPPPVYYSDLAAFRARTYLSWKMQEREGSLVSGGSSGSGNLTPEAIAQLQEYVKVKDNIVKGGMFFV